MCKELDDDNQWDMSHTRNAYRSLHDEAELYEVVDQDSTAVTSDGTTVGIHVTTEAVLSF
jgi:hypothetical protein